MPITCRGTTLGAKLDNCNNKVTKYNISLRESTLYTSLYPIFGQVEG